MSASEVILDVDPIFRLQLQVIIPNYIQAASNCIAAGWHADGDQTSKRWAADVFLHMEVQVVIVHPCLLMDI